MSSRLEELKGKLGVSKFSLIVYGKDGCYYTEKVKRFLTDNKLTFYYLNYLTANPMAKKELDELGVLLNHPTWPKVFYHGTFLGGYTETYEKLPLLLNNLV
jgi:glutaredoxin